MSSIPPINEPNPYASPSEAAWTPTPDSTDFLTAKLIRDFRSQSLALGVLWTFLGVVAIGLGVALVAAFGSNADLNARFPAQTLSIFIPLIAACGLCWLIAGVGTLMKQSWAVWVGLIMSYLSVAGNLLNFNLCGLIIAGAAILQGHRVLGFAAQMRRAGIPLTQKP